MGLFRTFDCQSTEYIMLIKKLKQLSLYNNWANDILLKTFEAHGDQMPASCLRLLSHIFNAQSTWLNRINGEKQVVGIWDLQDLEACKKLYSDTSQGIMAAIERHADDLDMKIGYANSQGQVFQNTLFDILFQVFNHATYHRAQIAMEMRINGLQPVNTDYIIFVRLGG
jgi:uncharacterized damage-inducible protein DinB